MNDELFDGRRVWVLTVVDTWSRVFPVMRVCRSATAMEVIEQARRQHGLPKTNRVSQFTSKELDLWAYANGITLDFSRPGKPTDNAYVESSNAAVRLECLGQHWFLDLGDAREKVPAASPRVALTGITIMPSTADSLTLPREGMSALLSRPVRMRRGRQLLFKKGVSGSAHRNAYEHLASWIT
jgi:transposase InsO family protein